ncbi:MAG TPA: 30S ribosomal protein S6 [Bacillota bacterium]|nr:30S ribosomal protein S6 [Peptococcaceae bacterium MAG4]NLW38804.1 30S ribosomal protein S6 [Peptococcaceae bacterium]HPZ44320.1 30S ribosomal protein S6 [Bacillota bacterium]HQD76967.1 30S ribosomal protein S6 [Bacillota bacterium]HUM59712.1 30S ribosomal protein S6 [Bacillota bacterium]
MRKYEVIFILRPDLDEEKNTEVIEKFKTLIESHGGEILKLDKWGKRKLAYEVKKFREGLYVLIQMKAESKVATELDRVFKITDEVLRHMIIREDE